MNARRLLPLRTGLELHRVGVLVWMLGLASQAVAPDLWPSPRVPWALGPALGLLGFFPMLRRGMPCRFRMLLPMLLCALGLWLVLRGPSDLWALALLPYGLSAMLVVSYSEKLSTRLQAPPLRSQGAILGVPLVAGILLMVYGAASALDQTAVVLGGLLLCVTLMLFSLLYSMALARASRQIERLNEPALFEPL